MDGPGSALIGVGAIGVGSLLLYGAYKNVPVFGSSGIFTQAVTTGKIVTPPAGTSATGKSGSPAGGLGAAVAGVPSAAGSILQATTGTPPPNSPFYLRLYAWVEKNLIGKGIT